MNKSDWLGSLIALFLAILMVALIFGGLSLSMRIHKQPQLVSLSVDIKYCYVIPEGTAEVSEDLAEFVGWCFWYPDRGLTLITKTYIGFDKNIVMLRGTGRAREAELLIMNREALKIVRREG